VGDGEAAARLLAQVTGKVRALLQERQGRRNADSELAGPGAHRLDSDVRFAA
jgi:hypothetical protein